MTTIHDVHGIDRGQALSALAAARLFGADAETCLNAYESILEPMTADQARAADLDDFGSDAIRAHLILQRPRVTRSQILAACESLGLDPTNTDYVVITPDTVTAFLFERDEHGRKNLSSAGEGYVRCKRTFDVVEDPTTKTSDAAEEAGK